MPPFSTKTLIFLSPGHFTFSLLRVSLFAEGSQVVFILLIPRRLGACAYPSSPFGLFSPRFSFLPGSIFAAVGAGFPSASWFRGGLQFFSGGLFGGSSGAGLHLAFHVCSIWRYSMFAASGGMYSQDLSDNFVEYPQSSGSVRSTSVLP